MTVFADVSDQLVGPHATEPPARLIEAGSPVYVLVGGILSNGATPGGLFELLMAPGIVKEFQQEYLPMMQFFRTARNEAAANAWLAWAGAPDDALQDLVVSGLIVRVDTANPLKAAASLRGTRIVPHAVPAEHAPGETLIEVRRTETSPVEALVTAELAQVLWGTADLIDLPKAIKRISKETRERHELTARRVLTNIPTLLRQGLAHLEWVTPPGL